MAKKAFTRRALHKKKEPTYAGLQYLRAKSSFWIAAFALTAFVSGNMIGQHGLYAFWASVLGKVDESLLTYTGVVSPIEFVPDYACWSRYGGALDKQHTYRELPEKCRIPLPAYDISKTSAGSNSAKTAYSVPYMGGYDSDLEGEGSHLGIDVRAPIGTPVRAVMDGVVFAVKEDSGGFGQYVVIMHRAPDPSAPSTTTILYSVYAHLSSQLVTEGQAVKKGTEIGLVGMTGYASGPHLHFQIDRDSAPWHPYWPFSSREASSAGMSFFDAVNAGLFSERGYQHTVHPMAYVQANYAPLSGTVAQASSRSSATASSSTAAQLLARERADRLRAERLARIAARRTAAQAIAARQVASAYRGTTVATGLADAQLPAPVASSSSSVASASSTSSSTSTTSSSAASVSTAAVAPSDIRFDAPGTFSDGTVVIEVSLVDAAGERILSPLLASPVLLTTAYGEATFSPEKLTAEHFKNGTATVRMFPSGRRTIVVRSLQYPSNSRAMTYAGQ